MLPHGHGLLDHVVQILGNLRSESIALEDTEDLIAGHGADLERNKEEEAAKSEDKLWIGPWKASQCSPATAIYICHCHTTTSTTLVTCAIPCESRSTTPIWDGVMPFLASLQIVSTTSLAGVFSQLGALRLYGLADRLIPFLEGVKKAE